MGKLIHIRLEDEELVKLEAAARADGRTPNKMVAWIVRLFLGGRLRPVAEPVVVPDQQEPGA